MRAWLLDRYAASTFITCPHRSLYCMAKAPIEIRVDPTTKPVACHSPATFPVSGKVHDDLLRDDAMGMLEKVLHDKSTEWCHRMVVTSNMMDLLTALWTCCH